MENSNFFTLNFLFIALFSLFSCSGGGKINTEDYKPELVHNDTLRNEKLAIESEKISDTSDEAEVFDVKHMLFNGKMKRIHTIDEFKAGFGEPDSTKLMSEEEPCTFVFENPDGSKDTDDKYLYKDGSRFENHKDSVALDEFRFYGNNFLKYKNIVFNSSTTVDDLTKIFPNAMNKIGSINVYGEGQLEMISLREDENNISEGRIFIFIKNNKLYYMHWWFPC